MARGLQHEGRLTLANKAVTTGQITSLREAAGLYDVPRSTLRDRVNGSKEKAIAN